MVVVDAITGARRFNFYVFENRCRLGRRDVAYSHSHSNILPIPLFVSI